MKFLLDTHILLWWLKADRLLSSNAQQIIENTSNQILVSSVNLWEIALKNSLGRLEIDLDDLRHCIDQSGFDYLPILPAHALAISGLKPLHCDPFDRMLVAQSRIESARLLTHDALVASYEHTILV